MPLLRSLPERATPEDLESAPVEPRLKPLLHYVRKLTLTPSRLTQSDADAVYAAGIGEESLVRAVAVCAYFNQMNRLVDGAGLSGGPAEHERAARPLVDEGYALGSGRVPK